MSTFFDILNDLLKVQKVRRQILLSDETLLIPLALTSMPKPARIVRSGFNDYFEEVAQGNMFEPAPSAVLVLPAKWSAKQWAELAENLVSATVNVPDLNLVVIGSVSLRNTIKMSPKGFKLGLGYAPEGLMLEKCAVLLSARHGLHDQKLASQAVHYYAGDLTSIDDHFYRMKSLNITFDNAFVAGVDVSAFDVIDALLGNDLSLVTLRINQLSDPIPLLGALCYFLRQVVAVIAEGGANSNSFQKCSVPYPAQGRVTIAVKKLKVHKIAQFLMIAPEYERKTRTDKNVGDFLCHELIGLLM